MKKLFWIVCALGWRSKAYLIYSADWFVWGFGPETMGLLACISVGFDMLNHTFTD